MKLIINLQRLIFGWWQVIVLKNNKVCNIIKLRLVIEILSVQHENVEKKII